MKGRTWDRNIHAIGTSYLFDHPLTPHSLSNTFNYIPSDRHCSHSMCCWSLSWGIVFAFSFSFNSNLFFHFGFLQKSKVESEEKPSSSFTFSFHTSFHVSHMYARIQWKPGNIEPSFLWNLQQKYLESNICC